MKKEGKKIEKLAKINFQRNRILIILLFSRKNRVIHSFNFLNEKTLCYKKTPKILRAFNKCII
jgi:hypothetical protein